MTDISLTIAPKSDQLNADDLIVGPLTIHITKVSANPESAEQPVSIFFDGDGGKPYRPCKSMRRVLVHVWGKDGSSYPGRSLTLYRDPKVQFGGLAVGGIRISHMSHLDHEMTMALTATRASRKPYTVKPLVVEKKKPTISDWLDKLEAELSADGADPAEILARDRVKEARAKLTNGALERLESIIAAGWARVTPPPDEIVTQEIE